MTAEKFKRKLAAILSADVKGYSRLMGEDEEGTIRTLNAYKEVMTGSIQQHRGRVVGSAGDSVLAEFASVVDAVRCAVGIQEELKDRNKQLAEDRRMEFRIGVNLGDVVEEGDTIYGDGVNIAARMESLAEAGGICISGMVYENIKNKLALGYEYVGEQTVKNIKEPVRVYRVVMEPGVTKAGKGLRGKVKGKRALVLGIVAAFVVVAAVVTIWQFILRPASLPVEKADPKKMAFPLADKPSIAVLSFVNMSDDPKQDYLGDGLSEDIITALSKVGNLFVIARESSFSYKGKPVKVKQVAEELGVRYVLEGSVRKAGDKTRITAQLIDAIQGHHLWAERYDRELKDIFAVQDRIIKDIITALQVQLKEGEEARTHAKGTESLEAYLRFLEARSFSYRNTKEDNARAQELIKQAIALDPNYAAAYAELAREIFLDVFLGASKSPKDSLMKAIELAKKAMAMDNSMASAQALLGQFFTMVGQHERGIAEAQKAVDLDPSSSRAYFALAFTLNFAGRHEEAIPHFEKAIRLNPFGPPNFWHHMAIAYGQTGQYDKAIAALKRTLQREPKDVLSYITLTSIYVRAGREEEARATAAEILKIDPNFSAERQAATLPWKDPAKNEQALAAFRKAGLK
jgi:adenylate cyclase